MPSTETTYRVRVSAPSRLRTELNVVAAVVAIAISLVILALLANSHSSARSHHPRSAAHGPRVVVHEVARP
jgi:hypothetical protein